MAEQRHETPHWLLSLLTWRDSQRHRTSLGSALVHEREAAIAWFAARGCDAVPMLRPALRGSIPIACGAATALYRLGEPEGIYWVLTRCYQEEWLDRSLQNGHLAELHALHCLGCRMVSTAMAAAFVDAALNQDGLACRQALIVALSALRLMSIFDDVLPLSVLEHALHFGPASLSISEGNADYYGVSCIATAIRMEAVTRLQRDYGVVGEDLLVKALHDADHHIAGTAIDGLSLHSVRRALPDLHTIAFGMGHPLAAKARRAIERIAGERAEALTLVRAAQPPTASDELLRAAETESEDNPETLVRMVTS